MKARLSELITVISPLKILNNLNVEVSGIEYDSRKIEGGEIFVCIRGSKADGHDFAPEAVRKGACALIVEKDPEEIKGLLPDGDTVIIQVENSRDAMARLALAFYENPSGKLRLIGVVGTNGKTTTTYMIKEIFEEAGHKVGLIGTIRNLIGNRSIPAKNTTPESLDIQRLLRQMVDEGIDTVVMEVSSHAIDLDRIYGCDFDLGVFTNITQDHLDYHKTFENYLNVKTSFFAKLGQVNEFSEKNFRKRAVINIDDPNADYIIERTKAPVITYSIGSDADISARDLGFSLSGVSFTLTTPIGTMPVSMKVAGRFNVYNALGAVGAAIASGIGFESIKPALERFKGAEGRFQPVDRGQDFTVIIDYAHTPDGLENILKAAKEFAERDIIVVFGCGGDRDKGKRPIMGEIAARYADHVIITSDNPRSEEPSAICAEIEVGVKRAGGNYRTIIDRREAIRHAIRSANAGDVVIIAGKGHEDYQIFKDRTIHFDDKEVAAEALEELSLG